MKVVGYPLSVCVTLLEKNQCKSVENWSLVSTKPRCVTQIWGIFKRRLIVGEVASRWPHRRGNIGRVSFTAKQILSPGVKKSSPGRPLGKNRHQGVRRAGAQVSLIFHQVQKMSVCRDCNLNRYCAARFLPIFTKSKIRHEYQSIVGGGPSHNYFHILKAALNITIKSLYRQDNCFCHHPSLSVFLIEANIYQWWRLTLGGFENYSECVRRIFSVWVTGFLSTRDQWNKMEISG